MRTAWLLVILGLLCASASQAQAPAGEGSSEVRENSSETAEATAALLSDTASGELPNDVTAGGECQQPGSGGSDTQPAEAVAEEAVCAAAETTLAASEQPSQEQEAAAPDLAAAQQATEADQLEQPPEEVSPAPPEPPEAPPADQHHDLKDFALLKDGAKILAANKEGRKPQALLDDDSDTFLKNDCKADKWVVVELGQVAKISRVALAQYELYSARVRDFEAWGRQSHPRTDGVGADYSRSLNSSQWKLLGNFTAEKQKGVQVFAIAQPAWVRFVLLRFLSQHGSEPVCALNGVSLFGKSAAEEFEDQLAIDDEARLDLLQREPDLEEGVSLELEPEEAFPDDVAQAAAAAAAGEEAAVPGAEQTDQPPTLQPGEVPAEQQPGVLAGDQVQEGQQQSQSNASVATTSADGNAAVPSGANGLMQQQRHQQPPPAQQPVPENPDPRPLLAGEGALAAPQSAEAPAAAEAAGVANASVTAPADAASAAPVQPSSDQAAHVGTDSTTGSLAGNASGATGPAAGRSDGTTPQPVVQPAAPPARVGGTVQPPPADSTVPRTAPPAKVPSPAGNGNGHGNRNGGAPATAAAPPADGLAGLPVGPAKGSGSGSSLYELLVQEIKGAKVQQKLLAKAVADLQRNSTLSMQYASMQYAELAGDLAALAADLSKVTREANLSEEALVVRVDALVRAHMVQLSRALYSIHASMAGAAKREHALLSLLAMLGAIFALGSSKLADQWPRAKWLVVLLALANGLVGLLLHVASVTAHGPLLQALPWAPSA